MSNPASFEISLQYTTCAGFLLAICNASLKCAVYILKEGNYNVILCERGIRGFNSDETRNVLDIQAIPYIKKNSKSISYYLGFIPLTLVSCSVMYLVNKHYTSISFMMAVSIISLNASDL